MTTAHAVTAASLRDAVPQLAHLPESDLTALLATGEACSFGDGETLFAEGEPGRALWFLVSGAVGIHKRLPNGRQVDLATLERGAIFGEIAMLAGTNRTASATAKGAVVALRVPGDALFADLAAGRNHAHVLVLAVARTLAARLETMNGRFTESVVLHDRGGDLDDFRRKMMRDWTA